MAASKVFFNESKQALFEFTNLFDFIWPTAGAMWNLRWQVNGYLNVRPDASVDELQKRFIEGSGIHGANLHRACIDHTWDVQTSMFGKQILINSISIFESYIDHVLESISINSESNRKDLQFPTTTIQSSGSKKGFYRLVDQISANKSDLITNEIYPKLRSHRNNSLSIIENLLTCYRYFKECRNTLSHSGGKANQKTLDAYNRFASIATKTNLGVAEVPEYTAIIIGDPVELSLRGVVGFCEIIIKMIVTIDAELARHKHSEDYLARKMINALGCKSVLPNENSKRKARIVGILNKCDLPHVDDYIKFNTYLIDKQIIMP